MGKSVKLDTAGDKVVGEVNRRSSPVKMRLMEAERHWGQGRAQNIDYGYSKL
jgi:hypothetical protein